MSRQQNKPSADAREQLDVRQHRLRNQALRSGGDEHAVDRLLRGIIRRDADDEMVEEFRKVRETMPAFRELPEHFAWESLSADMKANIALGLEAGDAVRPRGTVKPIGLRAGLVMAMLTLLMISGYWWQMPRRQPVPQVHQAVLQAGPGQVGVSEDETAFTVVFPEMQASTVFSGASGSVRADFVDDETGQLTIAHVYLD